MAQSEEEEQNKGLTLHIDAPVQNIGKIQDGETPQNYTYNTKED